MPFYKHSAFTGLLDRVLDADEVVALFDNAPILTYDDAALSGVPKVVRFSYQGTWYYMKAYPTIGAEAGSSGDAPGDNLYLVNDAALSGTPVVFEMESGAVKYYFKAYPTLAVSTYSAGDQSLRPTRYADAALSGIPRVVKAVAGGTPYYFKVYPTKG